jgi:hypothetical protein
VIPQKIAIIKSTDFQSELRMTPPEHAMRIRNVGRFHPYAILSDIGIQPGMVSGIPSSRSYGQWPALWRTRRH